MIFFSFCHFGVDQPFCYVVCEHLHNVDEGASYLSLFCFRSVSLISVVLEFKVENSTILTFRVIFIYRKVANSSLSWLVARFQIFRRLMKGKFDAYVL